MPFRVFNSKTFKFTTSSLTRRECDKWITQRTRAKRDVFSNLFRVSHHPVKVDTYGEMTPEYRALMESLRTSQTNAKACEDCGEETEKGCRRIRCPYCRKLICGWCRGHVHNEALQACGA
jgi:hypothetical protein